LIHNFLANPEPAIRAGFVYLLTRVLEIILWRN
jgi:hypothetical protein